MTCGEGTILRNYVQYERLALPWLLASLIFKKRWFKLLLKGCMEHSSVLSRLVGTFRSCQLLGCGFQNPDPALPDFDEVDSGDQPPAASAPAPQAKVRAPSSKRTMLVIFKFVG